MTTSKVIPLHRVSQVPYTVEGPYTKDSQEHHDFEDSLAVAIARESWQATAMSRVARVAGLVAVVASLVALALGVRG